MVIRDDKGLLKDPSQTQEEYERERACIKSLVKHLTLARIDSELPVAVTTLVERAQRAMPSEYNPLKYRSLDAIIELAFDIRAAIP